MKKTKYIYEHLIYQGDYLDFNRSEVFDFYEISGVKLHHSSAENYFYTWEFAGDGVSWFKFVRSEDVEINETVTKLPSDNRYKNGYNWKAKGTNAKLRKKKTNNLAEEKARKDAEFFKMREEFLKKQQGK